MRFGPWNRVAHWHISRSHQDIFNDTNCSGTHVCCINLLFIRRHIYLMGVPVTHISFEAFSVLV